MPSGEDIISMEHMGNGRMLILVNGETFTATLVSINREDKTVQLLLNGKKAEVKLKEPLDDLLHDMGLDKAAGKGASQLKAPHAGPGAGCGGGAGSLGGQGRQAFGVGGHEDGKCHQIGR